MINRPIPTADLLDWEPIHSDSIQLSADQIEQAIQQSQNILHPDQQWQVYLHQLALIGFEQWLTERAPDLTVNQDHCSILQPQYANIIESVCNLQVDQFRLCLIATGSLSDTLITLPRAIVELPGLMANFYVLVEVLEEQEQVRVYGHLRYDQLAHYRQSTGLIANADQTYSLPVDWFASDADNLLLNLRCLPVSTVSLPTATVSDRVSVAQLETKLAEIRSQADFSNYPLSHFLNWDEMATLLNHSELLSQVYPSSTNNTTSNITATIPDQVTVATTRSTTAASPTLSQTVINVGAWLQGQLDELAQQLAWVLMPAPTLATSALRSAIEDWDVVVEELEHNNIEIPFEAGRAYRDFQWDGMALRLYVATWAINELPQPEWTLLLVLGPQPGTSLPHGVKLQVRDDTQLLFERTLTDPNSLYLYAQVVGNLDEQFSVLIGRNANSMLTLPPFIFQPNPS